VSTRIPIDAKAFARFVKALPTPVGWNAQKRFLESVGVLPPQLSAEAKRFAELLRSAGRK